MPPVLSGRDNPRWKHGLSRTAEHKIWGGIISRCEDPENRYYAGRGIKMCQRWRDSFLNFLQDMGPRPSPSHSIERIDNDADYGPTNCRWATRLDQNRNTRQNRFLEFQGRRLTISQWSEVVGIKAGTIQFRIAAGWSTERALTEKPTNKGKIRTAETKLRLSISHRKKAAV